MDKALQCVEDNGGLDSEESNLYLIRVKRTTYLIILSLFLSFENSREKQIPYL